MLSLNYLNTFLNMPNPTNKKTDTLVFPSRDKRKGQDEFHPALPSCSLTDKLHSRLSDQNISYSKNSVNIKKQKCGQPLRLNRISFRRPEWDSNPHFFLSQTGALSSLSYPGGLRFDKESITFYNISNMPNNVKDFKLVPFPLTGQAVGIGTENKNPKFIFDGACAVYYVHLCRKRPQLLQESRINRIFQTSLVSFLFHNYNTDHKERKCGGEQTKAPKPRQTFKETAGQADRRNSFAHVAQVFGHKFLGFVFESNAHRNLLSLVSVGERVAGGYGKRDGQ